MMMHVGTRAPMIQERVFAFVWFLTAAVVALGVISFASIASDREPRLEPEVAELLRVFERPMIQPLLLPPRRQDIPERVERALNNQDFALTSRITLLYWASNPFVLSIEDLKTPARAIVEEARQVDLSAGWKFYLARSLWRIGFYLHRRSDPGFAVWCFGEADALLGSAIEDEPNQAVFRLERFIATSHFHLAATRASIAVRIRGTDFLLQLEDLLQLMRDFVDAPSYDFLAAPPYVEWLDDPQDARWLAVQGLIGWMSARPGVHVRRVASWAANNNEWDVLDLIAAFSLKYAEGPQCNHAQLDSGMLALQLAISVFMDAAREAGDRPRLIALERFSEKLSVLRGEEEFFERRFWEQESSTTGDTEALRILMFGDSGEKMVREGYEYSRLVSDEFLPKFRELVNDIRTGWKLVGS